MKWISKHGLRLGLAVCLSIVGSIQVQAEPLPSNSRVLFLGPAAATHGPALQNLIDSDSSVSGLGTQVDHHETDLLLSAFYEGAANWQVGGIYTEPYTPNPLLNELDEGHDVILIHPDRLILLWPEHFMESVRLIKRYAEPLGSRVLLIVPPHSSTQTIYAGYTDWEFPADNATMVKEQVYRIGDALDLEVVPAGLTWQELEQDPAITTPAFSSYSTSYSYIPEHYSPDLYAVNVYATTIYSALFEASASQSTYRHGGISNAEFAAVSGYAFQTWDNARTATHYTGPHLGLLSPVIPTPAYPGILYDPAYGFETSGASTEGFTSEEFLKIMRRKGVTPVGYNGPGPFEFDISRYSTSGSGDKVGIYQRYKAGIYTMVQEFTQGNATFHSPTRRPNKKVNPNYMAFTRLWTENPSFRVGNFGDGHLNEHGSMMMAAGIYAIMSGGEHPFLDGTVDLTDWTGPQRYAASIGYGTVMGAGKLAKLEEPPVSVGDPRHYLQRETPNDITLTGFDFDGLPVSVVVDTPPQYGTFVPNGATPSDRSGISGANFIYTPQAGFDGLDSVTYHVTNANGTSQPLTVYLSVGPYVATAPSGALIFEEDFDDQDVSDWTVDGNEAFSTAESGVTWLGVPKPYDGTATLRLWNSAPAEKAIDTTAFENLELTIRVGAGDNFDGANRYGYSGDIIAHVEWYDGTTWQPLVAHVMNWANYELLRTYQVSLPAGANDNDQFRLRLRSESNNGQATAAYFDSIQLSGDVIPRAPVVQDGSAVVAMNSSVEIALQASDENIFDVLEYNVNAPANGTVTGTPPLVTYTPDLNFTGTDTFTYSVDDGTFSSGDATVTVTVRDNSVPVVDAGSSVYAALVDTIPSAVSGADVFLDAGLESALDATWEDSLNTWNLTIDGNVSLVQYAENPLPGIAAAYDLPGGLSGNGGFEGASLHSLSADSQPITMEIWFKPDASASYPANGQILYETGGGTGFGIFYNNGMVEVAHDGNAGQISADVSSLTDQFIHVAVTFDTTSATENFKLYINGQLAAVGSRDDADLCGGDGAGLGRRGASNAGGAGGGDANTESFDGAIAIYRAYFNQVLSEEEVLANYESIAGGQSATVNLNATVSDGEEDPLVYSWSVVSGPGEVTFANPSAEDTTVTMSEAGTYVLRLTVSDGLESSFSDVTVTASAPITDDDNDGIDDAWETQHFPGQEHLIDGSGDADGDGIADFFEYLYDSDPTDALSRGFKMQAGPGGSAVVFEWTVKEGFALGAHYRIQYCTDLSSPDGWSTLPAEHYTLTPSTSGGKTRFELEITADHGDTVFIRLVQP